LLTGTVAPSNGLGTDGDSYLNTVTATLYSPKAGGVWPAGIPLIGPAGSQGNQGPNGLNGKTIYNGTVPPGIGIGNDGDFYVDTLAKMFYGPKSGSWPAGFLIQGVQGIQGPQGIGINYNSSGTLAQRAAFNLQAQGYAYLQTDVSPFQLWVKASAASADWAGPTFIAGIVGIGDYGLVTDTTTATYDYGVAA
jgi:hypothetical protein